MDSTLWVELTLDGDCRLTALDKSPYREAFTHPEHHAIIEFVKDSNFDIIMHRLHQVKDFVDLELWRSQSIDLPEDGNYKYYRLVMPTLEHYRTGDKYYVRNCYFVYHHNVYYSKHDLDSFSVDKVERVNDYERLWRDRESISQMYWFSDNIFSLCRFKKCLVSMIQKVLNNSVRNGCNHACTDSIDQKNVDFLFETYFAIHFLVERGRYDDAQRLLNSVKQCSNFCDQELTNNVDCGCGTAKR